jgi:hypothetical protein
VQAVWRDPNNRFGWDEIIIIVENEFSHNGPLLYYVECVDRQAAESLEAVIVSYQHYSQDPVEARSMSKKTSLALRWRDRDGRDQCEAQPGNSNCRQATRT